MAAAEKEEVVEDEKRKRLPTWRKSEVVGVLRRKRIIEHSIEE